MYREFARFYDGVEGDAPHSFTRWIGARVTRYDVAVESVLELGSGTGAVLAALPEEWEKTGVDISPEMLAEARRKGVGATFVEADLTRIDLGRRFDLVLCVFDTVNHLLTPEAWQQAFAVARAHLRDGGLFLFDLNTLARLRQLAAEPHWVADFDDHTLIMKIADRGGDLYDWDVRVFERTGDCYTRHHEVIPETSFHLADVRAWLADAGFEVLEIDERYTGRATEQSSRAFAVCRTV